MFLVCLVFAMSLYASVHMCFVVTCWERADLLASFVCCFFLFDLILYVPSTIFQLYRDGSSWVEPVLKEDKCILLKDHKAVTPVRLEPAALRSQVKHSTTEPLRSLASFVVSTVSLSLSHWYPGSGVVLDFIDS